MTRHGKMFTDTIEWVYTCSCDMAGESTLIGSLQHVVNISLNQFQTTFTYCLHVQSVKAIVMSLDCVNEIYPEYDFNGNYEYYHNSYFTFSNNLCRS